ncbi:hypothetical protein WA1_00865 [Scytonema hofmannii PCC 7110]|uniref:Uncharacterized protein n=1 Tax=Scytonema hofmannii PCC 7110 TaxID=128403 RepID=A0A139XGD3_9CYAN|nr:DUF6073 family protein [Scytonema hofmannii]KYC43748.1 hypothetical protein WA1_00865 [Scytonema hofmannii PCC 7110]
MTAADTLKNHHSKKLAWGPQIDLNGLDYLYPPQAVEPYTPPVPGVDNLGITSTDTFLVPSIGEFTVNFQGYVRVARSQPTTNHWNTAEVFTNLIDMCMRGEAPGIGSIIVTLNPDILSTGQLRTPYADINCEKPAKACRMAVGALFNLPQLNMTLFNKEPIELTIDDVRAIPPAGNPGNGQIYHILPLFDLSNPDGAPAAYLTGLKFTMGHYVTEAKIQSVLQGS